MSPFVLLIRNTGIIVLFLLFESMNWIKDFSLDIDIILYGPLVFFVIAVIIGLFGGLYCGIQTLYIKAKEFDFFNKIKHFSMKVLYTLLCLVIIVIFLVFTLHRCSEFFRYDINPTNYEHRV